MPLTPIKQALADYYAAFSTLDVDAILPYFEEPCMSIAAQSVYVAFSHTEIAEAFRRLMDNLRAQGYGRSEFLVEEIRLLSDTAAMVIGVAVRYSKIGAEMERVGISYVFHNSEEQWKIVVLIPHYAHLF